MDAEGFLHFAKHALEVCPFAVDLVDDEQNRQVELLGILPREFGSHFHAARGVEDDHDGVHHAHGVLDFAHEVAHPRRVEEVDLAALVLHEEQGGVDRDAAFCLFRVVVGDGAAVLGAAHAVNELGVECDRLH